MVARPYNKQGCVRKLKVQGKKICERFEHAISHRMGMGARHETEGGFYRKAVDWLSSE